MRAALLPALAWALGAAAFAASAPAQILDADPDIEAESPDQPDADAGEPEPLHTISPEAVREMVGVWRGRVPTGERGVYRDVGLELKLLGASEMAVTYLWGPGTDSVDDPPGIATGQGQINFDGTVEFRFMQNPPYEITLVMAYDPPGRLIVLWNELDTGKLRLRQARMSLSRVGR